MVVFHRWDVSDGGGLAVWMRGTAWACTRAADHPLGLCTQHELAQQWLGMDAAGRQQIKVALSSTLGDAVRAGGCI